MSSIKEVLNDWYYRVKVAQLAHFLSSHHFGQKRYWLGVPAVALSTIVGTSVFATLQKQPDAWIQILIGLGSVLAALLTSLQIFLGYAERAEKHRIAGAKYGALGRELEVLRASSDTPSAEMIEDIRKRLDALAIESPTNSVRIYHRAEGKIVEPPSATKTAA